MYNQTALGHTWSQHTHRSHWAQLCLFCHIDGIAETICNDARTSIVICGNVECCDYKFEYWWHCDLLDDVWGKVDDNTVPAHSQLSVFGINNFQLHEKSSWWSCSSSAWSSRFSLSGLPSPIQPYCIINIARREWYVSETHIRLPEELKSLGTQPWRRHRGLPLLSSTEFSVQRQYIIKLWTKIGLLIYVGMLQVHIELSICFFNRESRE